MPSHVIWFERLMYGALLASLVGLVLYAQRAEDPLDALAMAFLLFFFGIMAAALAGLIWLVARRRMGWGRYVVCVLFILLVPHFLRQALSFGAYPVEQMLAWAQFLMLGAACVLLFTSDARAWFAHRPPQVGDHP
jgi:hypothetical protein